MTTYRTRPTLLARPLRIHQRPLAAACAALLGLTLAGAASAQQVQEQTATPTGSQTAPVDKKVDASAKKNKKSENTVSNLDAGDLEELITEAWLTQAPRKLVQEFLADSR